MLFSWVNRSRRAARLALFGLGAALSAVSGYAEEPRPAGAPTAPAACLTSISPLSPLVAPSFLEPFFLSRILLEPAWFGPRPPRVPLPIKVSLDADPVPILRLTPWDLAGSKSGTSYYRISLTHGTRTVATGEGGVAVPGRYVGSADLGALRVRGSFEQFGGPLLSPDLLFPVLTFALANCVTVTGVVSGVGRFGTGFGASGAMVGSGTGARLTVDSVAKEGTHSGAFFIDLDGGPSVTIGASHIPRLVPFLTLGAGMEWK